VKARLIASVAALAVVVAVLFLFLRAPGPDASARPAGELAPKRSSAPPRAPDPDLPWPARDPFRYVDEHRGGPGATTSPRPAPPASVVAAPAPSANPLRLIGLVRKGGSLKAAVSMWGETVVLGTGEESRGYRVLSIDDEGGVRLRGPDGSELMLPPSSF